MLFYFITFTIVGFIISVAIKKNELAVGIMAVIAVFWGFAWDIFWGIVSFGEMLIGYAIQRYLVKHLGYDLDNQEEL